MREQRQQLKGTCFYWQVQETLKTAHMTPLWYRPMKETMNSTGTLEKNMSDLGECRVRWNFISHYISNLIMWRNVTPTKSLGVDTELTPVERPGDLTAWSLHVICYRWRIRWTPVLRRGRAASLCRKPRPPIINGSSWTAAMSCQAALGMSPRCTCRLLGGRLDWHHVPEWPRDQAHTLSHTSTSKTGPSIHSASLREWN